MKTHRIWKFGPNIDTDALAPGHAMKYGIDKIAQHCLESIRAEFAQLVRPGDVIVAGENFGIGSSREQAAGALIQLGVAAVIAPSFGGLFFRNAFNLGLLLITCEQAHTLEENEQILIGERADWVEASNGRRLTCETIPDFLLDMVGKGGLLPSLRQQLAKNQAAGTKHHSESRTP
ncbi:MAG: 3-isopropylmalate dehydratase [Hylemonella sp.]